MRILLILFSFACFATAYDHNLYIENVKRVQNSLPTGTVLIWWTQADVPEDFIECDGRPVPEGTELRKLMSHTPNYVGKFLKGADKTRGEKAGDEKGEKLITFVVRDDMKAKKTLFFETGTTSLLEPHHPNYISETYSPIGMPEVAYTQELIFMTEPDTEIFINDLATDIDGQTYSQSKQIYKKRTDHQDGKYITQLSVLHTRPSDDFDYVSSMIDYSSVASPDFNIQYNSDPIVSLNFKTSKGKFNYNIFNLTYNNPSKSLPVHVNTRYIIKL